MAAIHVTLFLLGLEVLDLDISTEPRDDLVASDVTTELVGFAPLEAVHTEDRRPR